MEEVKHKFIYLFILLIMSISLFGCKVQTPIINSGNIPVFNESPVNCSEYIQGNIYYNNATKTLEVCNGTIWGSIK